MVIERTKYEQEFVNGRDLNSTENSIIAFANELNFPEIQKGDKELRNIITLIRQYCKQNKNLPLFSTLKKDAKENIRVAIRRILIYCKKERTVGSVRAIEDYLRLIYSKSDLKYLQINLFMSEFQLDPANSDDLKKASHILKMVGSIYFKPERSND